MSNAHTRPFLSLALAVAVLSGQLVDQTTGQPLTRVHVQVAGPSHGEATSDAHGRFTIAGLRPGRYTVDVESNDVPQQSFHVTVAPSGPTAVTMKACSMTLDYHCAMPGGGG